MKEALSPPDIQTPSPFVQTLESHWREKRFLCIGLDPHPDHFPLSLNLSRASTAIFEFNRQIIGETVDLVCAYKPNLAFYESHGPGGLEALMKTIRLIKHLSPLTLVILDCKKGDIESTNRASARFAFTLLGADAVTVNPYLGYQSLTPFLEQKDKGVFVLAKTSNPASSEFQNLSLSKNHTPLFLHIAKTVSRSWNRLGNCGLVVGATYPQDLGRVRQIAPLLPLLVPGIGSQQGDLEQTVANARDKNNQGFIINSARQIIHASKEADFAKKARIKAQRLNRQIIRFLK